MAQLRTHTISNFSGMNRRVSSVAKDKGEFEILLNWDLGTVAALTKVPGTTQIGSQMIDNQNVESIYGFSFVSAATITKNRLVCTVSSTLYYSNLDTASPTLVAATGYAPVVGETTSFATINNDLYATCATRGTYRSSDGGATFTALSAATPKFRFLSQYRNYLWGSGHSPATQIGKSNIGGSTAFVTKEFEAGASLAAEVVEDAVTGTMSQVDQLIIAMASGRIARNNTEIQRTFATKHLGVKHTNMVETDYFGFWRTYRDIFAYTGNSPQSIGKRIRDLLEAGSSDIMFAFQKTINAFLGNLTIDNEVLVNLLAIYDVESDAFMLRDDLPIKSATQVVWNGKEYLAFGDNDGNVWVINPAVTKNPAGARSAITALAISVPQYIVNPKYIKAYHGIFVVSDNAEGTILSVSVDNGQWIEIGQLNKDFTEFKDLSEIIPRGHQIRYRLTNVSDGKIPRLESIEFTYEITNEDTD